MDREARQADGYTRDAAQPSLHPAAADQSQPRLQSYRPRGMVLQNGRWVDRRATVIIIDGDDLA